jgi:hypothetical protein
MDATDFASLARSLFVARSRRRTLVAALAAALSTLGLAHRDDAAAVTSGKCTRKPRECEFCKKGKCERKHGEKRCRAGKIKAKADGTTCTGGSCQHGQCIAPGGSLVTPPTGDPTGGGTGDPPLSSCIPVCDLLQTCTSTSQCPPETQCGGCAAPTDLRCVPLCAN